MRSFGPILERVSPDCVTLQSLEKRISMILKLLEAYRYVL